MKKTILLFITTTLIIVSANAQGVLSIEDRNSIYKKEEHHNKIVQQYAPLREADAMWQRRIWREIDLRQKINHSFYYPENDGIAAVTDDRKSLKALLLHMMQHLMTSLDSL
jgi:hypothetical protein